jgi:hypothetical protein
MEGKVGCGRLNTKRVCVCVCVCWQNVVDGSNEKDITYKRSGCKLSYELVIWEWCPTSWTEEGINT